MKFALLALSLVLPFAAQADFVPGRVRPTAAAEMEVTKATGKYEGVKKVTLSALSTDGKQLYTGYSAKIDGEVIQFSVSKIKKTDCGMNVKAISLENMVGSESSTLNLVDLTGRMLCMRTFEFSWERVKLVTVDYATGEESTIEMQGNPEFFSVTL